MKPTLVLVSILSALFLVSFIGYGLGQLGNAPECECPRQTVGSDQEVKAGFSDLASAFAKIEPLQELSLGELELEQWSACWPKMMPAPVPEFSESEHAAMTMMMVGMMMLAMDSATRTFEQAMERCEGLG